MLAFSFPPDAVPSVLSTMYPHLTVLYLYHSLYIACDLYSSFTTFPGRRNTRFSLIYYVVGNCVRCSSMVHLGQGQDYSYLISVLTTSTGRVWEYLDMNVFSV